MIEAHQRMKQVLNGTWPGGYEITSNTGVVLKMMSLSCLKKFSLARVVNTPICLKTNMGSSSE